MDLLDLKEIEVKKDFLGDIVKNNKYNRDVILDYYFKLHSEDPQLNLTNKIESVSSCNSWFLLDVYKEQKVKDFKKTNLCKDKFCNNCKKVKQASRLSKFVPQIEKIKEDHSLHLLTLTVPNCNGTDLKNTIDKIFSSFKRLNRYLNGDLKIKNIDFSSYGYKGSLRSLEVTFKGDSYHPHIHAVIALRKDYKPIKNIINTYSYSYGKLERQFSDFEILVQKIWYLLMNGIRVNEKAIRSLEEGYSCTIDDIEESSYYEVFKYMTKATDEDKNILTYDNFKTLYFALYRVRQIQGYGLFYNFKDDDSLIDEVDDLYNIYINILKAKEDPTEVTQTPEDLLNDKEYLIISRKKIFSYLKNL